MSQSSINPDNYSISERLALAFYSAVTILVSSILFLYWLLMFALRKPHFDLHRLSRFSLYTHPLRKCDLLIHCVSVGEVNVAASLIRKLRTTTPDLTITVTTTTPTGANNVKNSLPGDVQHLYLPLDIGWFMSRLLKRVRPKRVLIVEVELWPNMIKQCFRYGIPAFVVNARLTDNSANSYQKLGLLIQPMLRNLSKVCAQAPRDFVNYQTLGVASSKLVMTGNIKFELDLAVDLNAQRFISDLGINARQIIIAGSTHEPEEQVLLDAAAQLKAQYPQLLWLIVPRHPQRFDKVQGLIKRSGLAALRSSDGQQIKQDTTVVLVDQMGVLSGLYSFADIAFVGGSIADRGGHNALEPAAVGVPVLMGPHRYNNPGICDVLAQQGNLQSVNSTQDVVMQIQNWLANDEQRRQAGLAGKQVVEQNRGAAERTIQAIQLSES